MLNYTSLCTFRYYYSILTKVRAGRCLILVRMKQRPSRTYTDEAKLLVKDPYVQFKILTRYDGGINLIR
jgi:hypothetical protein